MRKKGIIILFLISFLTSFLYSGTTGKVKGVVKDETGEPLAGANVSLEGTSWGAETDEDGYYYIIGVRAGTYKLKAQFIGYSDAVKPGIKVRVGLSTKTNFKMLPSDVLVDEAVIEVEMVKSVESDVTTAVRKIDMEALETSATSDVSSLLSKTTGVKKDADGELHFRGGRSGEVAYVIDGVSISDPTGAKSAPTSINFANVESFEIKPGIPEAEYGNALSGSVNIVYKVGDQALTSGHVKYETDAFMGDSRLNLHRGEFSLSGPLSFFGLKMNPTYYIATDLSLQDGFSRSYRVDGVDNGDYISYDDYDLTGLGFKLPSARENNFNIITKLAYEFTDKISTTLTFSKGSNHNYQYTWNNKYSPETAAETIEDITNFNVNFKQVIDQNSFYDVIFSYYNRKYERLPGGNKPDELIPENRLDGFDGGTQSFDGNLVRDGGDCEGYLDANRNGYFDREYFLNETVKIFDGIKANGDTIFVKILNISNYVGDFDHLGYSYSTTYDDANGNGIYDGDFLYDSDHDGEWDYWETGNSYSGFFSEGESNVLSSVYIEGYVDNNFDGHFANLGIYRVDGSDRTGVRIDGDELGNAEPYKDRTCGCGH